MQTSATAVVLLPLGRATLAALAESPARFAAPQSRSVGTAAVVRAHTAPERNASVRILEKLGFTHRGGE
jgi:hypothetical protein